MSPELVKNERYSFKSDIWSVGCILFELATFQRPFVGENIFDIFDSIVNDEIPSITHLYSKELNKLLKRILVKSQKDRPSAEELLCEPLIVSYVKVIFFFRVLKTFTVITLFYDSSKLFKSQ
jgi:serine/threonine protein kinase